MDDDERPPHDPFKPWRWPRDLQYVLIVFGLLFSLIVWAMIGPRIL